MRQSSLIESIGERGFWGTSIKRIFYKSIRDNYDNQMAIDVLTLAGYLTTARVYDTR